MDIKKNLIEKLKVSPLPLFDLKSEEIQIIDDLIQSKTIKKFVDNGSCNYPISTLHRDAYYIKLI